MAGYNKAKVLDRLTLAQKKTENPLFYNRPCVFLSHQKSDRVLCRKIADYLKDADIDVYFDEDDSSLSDYVRQGNSSKVTETIKKGISNSSHMLCIVSQSTLKSLWVPFEIGFGYDKTKLQVLTLKGISNDHLPDYLKTVSMLRGIRSLNNYVSEISGKTTLIMEQRNKIINFSKSLHPLDSVLDWDK